MSEIRDELLYDGIRIFNGFLDNVYLRCLLNCNREIIINLSNMSDKYKWNLVSNAETLKVSLCFAMIFRAFLPMEPVEPRIVMRFIR